MSAFEQLEGKSVKAAALETPLDVNQQDGSTTPEASKVAVCTTSSSSFVASPRSWQSSANGKARLAGSSR